MAKLIPIRYNKKPYPQDIKVSIEEIAANFGNTQINPEMDYSLHTEYSAWAFKEQNPILDEFSDIKFAQKKGIFQLWKNGDWVKDFVKFLQFLIQDHPHPKIIEIHPPFDDYDLNISSFLDLYHTFENRISKLYPETKIVIENRYGTAYSGGKFLISSNSNLIDLSKLIYNRKLALRIVLDIPQLFSSQKINLENVSKNEINEILHPIYEYREFILGIHLWGKNRSPKGRLVSHQGDLNSLFNNNFEMKNYFLKELFKIFDDEIIRFFVPEVNGKAQDLISIVKDLLDVGFKFV